MYRRRRVPGNTGRCLARDILETILVAQSHPVPVADGLGAVNVMCGSQRHFFRLNSKGRVANHHLLNVLVEEQREKIRSCDEFAVKE